MAEMTDLLRSLSALQAERASALLDDAVELTPAARAGWLAALAASQPALVAVIAGLLEAAAPPAGPRRPS